MKKPNETKEKQRGDIRRDRRRGHAAMARRRVASHGRSVMLWLLIPALMLGGGAVVYGLSMTSSQRLPALADQVLQAMAQSAPPPAHDRSGVKIFNVKSWQIRSIDESDMSASMVVWIQSADAGKRPVEGLWRMTWRRHTPTAPWQCQAIVSLDDPREPEPRLPTAY